MLNDDVRAVLQTSDLRMILAALVEEPRQLSELADILAKATNLTRTHIETLRRRGLVERDPHMSPSGPGMATYWRPTNRGEELAEQFEDVMGVGWNE